jgi:glutamyl-tRNA synthetase
VTAIGVYAPTRARDTGDDVGTLRTLSDGALHLGNLRTALLAWLAARQRRRAASSCASRTSIRSRPRMRRPRLQLEDLAALGIDWDAEPVRQSERFDLYRAAIDELAARELVYPCWCTRREIQQRQRRPHGEPAPGRRLPRHLPRPRQRRARRERSRQAPRVATPRAGPTRDGVETRSRVDSPVLVDDVVVQRKTGIPAYTLAVVVRRPRSRPSRTWVRG